MESNSESPGIRSPKDDTVLKVDSCFLVDSVLMGTVKNREDDLPFEYNHLFLWVFHYSVSLWCYEFIVDAYPKNMFWCILRPRWTCNMRYVRTSQHMFFCHIACNDMTISYNFLFGLPFSIFHPATMFREGNLTWWIFLQCCWKQPAVRSAQALNCQRWGWGGWKDHPQIPNLMVCFFMMNVLESVRGFGVHPVSCCGSTWWILKLCKFGWREIVSRTTLLHIVCPWWCLAPWSFGLDGAPAAQMWVRPPQRVSC